MAPLVAFPLVLLGFAAHVAIGLWLSAHLPRIRCGRWTRFAVSAALFLAALPVVVWGSAWGSKALTIWLAYGSDEYAAGLRIVNRHGDLTDGRRLNDFWNGVWGAMMFLSFLFPTLPPLVFWRLTDRRPDPEADRGRSGEAVGA